MTRPPASIVPLALAIVCAAVLPGIRAAETPYVMEKLGRGVVAVRSSETAVYVGWRLLATDDPGVRFNVYRSTDGQAPLKINRAPVAATTDFVDAGADLTRANEYTVRPIVDSREQPASAAAALPANAAVQQFLTIPLQRPAGGTVEAPPGSPATSFTYSPNDASVGDLDGDGDYEIVVKWDPSNSRDTASPGVTGPVILDAYKLDGTRLWRIDLGRNIRAGAHYTQFIVYDLDGDGRAEVACKTADGTVDGQRRTIWRRLEGLSLADGATDGVRAKDASDRRYGKVLAGPEYFTIFDGRTGAALATTDYVPGREPQDGWGGIGGNGGNDNNGNRVDRFLAGVAYLDGRLPSVIMARGYYGRIGARRLGLAERRASPRGGSSIPAARRRRIRTPRPRPTRARAITASRSPTSTATAGTRSSTDRWSSTTTGRGSSRRAFAMATRCTSAISIRRARASRSSAFTRTKRRRLR